MNGSKASWYLIDSNIFLRFLVRDNQQMWQDCVHLFQVIEQGSIRVYMPTIVAAEVQFVLFSFYAFNKAQVLSALKGMAEMPNLRVYDDTSVSHAISLYEKKNIKFVDCLLTSSKRVQSGNAIVVSYDHDFDKLGVQRVEPKELLK